VSHFGISGDGIPFNSEDVNANFPLSKDIDLPRLELDATIQNNTTGILVALRASGHYEVNLSISRHGHIHNTDYNTD
jgi:hypothetical protein